LDLLDLGTGGGLSVPSSAVSNGGSVELFDLFGPQDLSKDDSKTGDKTKTEANPVGAEAAQVVKVEAGGRPDKKIEPGASSSKPEDSKPKQAETRNVQNPTKSKQTEAKVPQKQSKSDSKSAQKQGETKSVQKPSAKPETKAKETKAAQKTSKSDSKSKHSEKKSDAEAKSKHQSKGDSKGESDAKQKPPASETASKTQAKAGQSPPKSVAETRPVRGPPPRPKSMELDPKSVSMSSKGKEPSKETGPVNSENQKLPVAGNFSPHRASPESQPNPKSGSERSKASNQDPEFQLRPRFLPGSAEVGVEAQAKKTDMKGLSSPSEGSEKHVAEEVTVSNFEFNPFAQKEGETFNPFGQTTEEFFRSNPPHQPVTPESPVPSPAASQSRFGEILQCYIQPPEKVNLPLFECKPPEIPSFPKFEATPASVTLAQFVKEKFGVEPCFIGGSFAGHAEEVREGAYRESTAVGDDFLCTI
jgi:hypothetical protein